MPKIPLTPLHRTLHRLAGKWRGEEKIAPSPWDPTGAVAQGVVRNRSELEGLVVLQEYEQSRDGAMAFQGHGVFHVGDDEIVLDWWDTWSPTPRTFRGGVTRDLLTLTSDDPKGMARATWRLGDSAYDYTLEVSQDGTSWYTYMTASYHRT